MTADLFFGFLRRRGYPATPVGPLREELGEELVAYLRRSGWLGSSAILDGDWYPCPSPGGDGCPRRVVTFSGQLTAVCGCAPQDCADVVLDANAAELLSVTPATVRWGLGVALRLDEVDGGPSVAGQPVRLGTRRFGEAVVAFWYAPALRDRHRDWLELLPHRERGRTPVLIVPESMSVRGAEADAARALRISVLVLRDVFDLEAGHVDLAELVLEHRFPGLDPGRLLGDRFLLVLDPEGGRYWFEGKPLPALGQWPLTASMLVALAESPGAVVSRDQLCGAMWPDGYGARGWDEIDWDRRIRDQRGRLAKASGGALPVVAHSHGADVQGGYALRLRPEQIAWWSRRV